MGVVTRIILVGGDRDVYESLGSEFGTVEQTSVEEASGSMEEGIDGIVVDYDAVGDTFADIFDGVRNSSPDAAVVLFSESLPERVEIEDNHVFDFVAVDKGHEEVVSVVRDAVSERTQVAYPLPEDEDKRAEEAQNYLDMDDEFDRLTRIAKACFDTELAFVSLINETRQSVLSCYGTDIDSVPREDTVCTYQILDEGVMVIGDIEEDRRLKDNDLLLSLGLRSYAGAPLVSPSGKRIGSFCVMDTEPREFDDEDKEMISLFAEEASEKVASYDGGDGS